MVDLQRAVSINSSVAGLASYCHLGKPRFPKQALGKAFETRRW